MKRRPHLSRFVYGLPLGKECEHRITNCRHADRACREHLHLDVHRRCTVGLLSLCTSNTVRRAKRAPQRRRKWEGEIVIEYVESSGESIFAYNIRNLTIARRMAYISNKQYYLIVIT